MNTIRWFFTLQGRVSRAEYLPSGAGLMFVKLALDWVLCRFVLDVVWSPLMYVMAIPAAGLTWNAGAPFVVLGLASLPFCWVGAAMTLRRMRDAGLPAGLVVLYAMPFFNWVLFAIAAALPSHDTKHSSSRPRGDDEPLPKSATGMRPAVIATGVTAAQIVLAILLVQYYGGWLFLGVPFVQGLVVGALTAERRLSDSMQQLAIAFGLTTGLLLGVALEGLACIVMAAPIWGTAGTCGVLAGRAVKWRRWRHAGPALLVAPLGQVLEPALQPPPAMFDVTTELVVKAEARVVWQHLVEFGEIAPPAELPFRCGIAYPVRATIDGRGPGAIRRCTFNTGDFVEPIEVWDEPRLLRFGVLQWPQPMIEWNPFHDHVDAAHLHGFFAAKRGQFELIARPDGTTLLRGTTWYTHGLRPEGYWTLWSDWLLHTIHRRVLEHIRDRAER